MAKYVRQFGTFFFELTKVDGYLPRFACPGTKITDEEYTKLFYSGERENLPTFNKNSRISHIRIQGNANEILGREIYTINAKQEVKNGENEYDGQHDRF